MQSTRRNLGVTLALVAFLGTAGCDGRLETPLQVLGAGGGGALAVQVSDESGNTSPTYRWTGDTARRLTVRAVGGGQVLWDLQATDVSAGFRSPVQHGLVPSGAREAVVAQFLDPGVRYEVVVVGTGGGQGTFAFTPTPVP